MQQQARRLLLSSDEKQYITTYNKEYAANKRAKLRVFNNFLTSNKTDKTFHIRGNDNQIHSALSSTSAHTPYNDIEQKVLHRRKEKQRRASMSEEEKKEIRRNQQKLYHQRKKAKLQALDDLIQSQKQIPNSPTQSAIIAGDLNVLPWEPQVILAEQQKLIKQIRQKVKQERMELRKEKVELLQEPKRIRDFHNGVQTFNPQIISSNIENQDNDTKLPIFPSNIINADINAESVIISQTIDLSNEDINTTLPTTQRQLEDEILIANPYAEISRKTLSLLNGREWLNDQVINFYMHMLLQRDHTLFMETTTNSNFPTRLRSWFSSTFFFAKLLENGQYNYNAVRRWTRRATIDVFSADKVIIPININNNHWTALVFYMLLKEVHYYDSSNGDGSKYLQYGLRWLTDECIDKKGIVLNSNEWRCFHKESGIPQQNNGYDCGVFVIMCARALAYNQPLTSYHQDDMQRYRLMIRSHILRGSLLDSNNQSLPYMYDLASTNPVQNQNCTINTYKCANVQSNGQTITIDTILKTRNITPLMENENRCNREESDDSDDSELNSQAVLPTRKGRNIEDSEDSEEDKNDGNNTQANMSSSAVILESCTSPTTLVTPAHEKPKTIFQMNIGRVTICVDGNMEENIKFDAAFEDQSDTCEKASNHSMHAIKDISKSIRLKTNAASHKRSYWKKKQDKKRNSNDYKAGLIAYNDLDLQSFPDGQQLRHR